MGPQAGRCETFQAQHALDLLSAKVREISFESGSKRCVGTLCVCLERQAGDDCDRTGRPPTIRIGSDKTRDKTSSGVSALEDTSSIAAGVNPRRGD